MSHPRYCHNCHYPLPLKAKHCPQCSQKYTTGKVSVGDLIHELVHTQLHLDSIFFYTLRYLFVPGKLTIEYFKGRHKRYAHPVRLFLVLGVFCFALINVKTHYLDERVADSNNKNRQLLERSTMLNDLDSVREVLATTMFKTKAERAAMDSLVRHIQPSDPLARVQDSLSLGDIMGRLMSGFDEEDIYTIPPETQKSSPMSDFKEGFMNGVSESSSDSTIQKITRDGKESLAIIRTKPDGSKDTTFTNNPFRVFAEGIREGVREEAKKAEAVPITTDTLAATDDIIPTELMEEEEEETDETLAENPADSISNAANGENEKRKFALKDIYNLHEGEILEYYKIEGFWERLRVKQVLKIFKEGNGLGHYFVGKTFWMLFLLMPVLAAIMRLLYFRRDYYFVEHIVFLFHYHAMIFVALMLAIYANNYVSGLLWNIVVLGILLFLYLAMRNVYKQGHLKTFLKFSFLSFSYLLLFMISFLFTIIFSFLFF